MRIIFSKFEIKFTFKDQHLAEKRYIWPKIFLKVELCRALGVCYSESESQLMANMALNSHGIASSLRLVLFLQRLRLRARVGD